MKRAVQQCAPLSRLFTAEETRGLVTEADVRANREFDRAAGPSGILDFLGRCAVFSPTDSMSSWVVWALNEVGEGGTGLDGAGRTVGDDYLAARWLINSLIRQTHADGGAPLPRGLGGAQPARARPA